MLFLNDNEIKKKIETNKLVEKYFIFKKYPSSLEIRIIKTKILAKIKKNEKTLIPYDLDYLSIKGLSNEVVERLIIHKPSTLGQATRLEGVTPAAINLIAITIKKNQLLERA